MIFPMHQIIQLDTLNGGVPMAPAVMQVDWVHIFSNNDHDHEEIFLFNYQNHTTFTPSRPREAYACGSQSYSFC